MRSRTRISLPAVGLAAASLALSACGGGGGAAATSSTGTLPPLPPSQLAFVTLAGNGGNIGFGHDFVPINLSNGAPQVGAKVRVGTYPDAIAVNRSGTIAYVANYASNTVTPVDLRTNKAGHPILAGIGPADIAIAPDGRTAYVTDDGSASALGSTITPINLATNRPEAPIKVGPGPQGIVITPDGHTAYVADAGAIVAGQTGGVANTVTPVNLLTKHAGHPITVGNGPTGIAISPDGATVFVTNLDSGSVSPISTSSNTAGAPISVPGGPVAVAVAGGFAWVVDTPSGGAGGDNVVPINVSSNAAGAPISVGKGAQDIAISPNQRRAFVTCLSSNEIVPITLKTRHTGTPIHLVGGPFGIALANQAAGGSSPTASSAPSTTTKKKS